MTFSSIRIRKLATVFTLCLVAAFPAACADAGTKAKHAQSIDKQGEFVDFNSWQEVQTFTTMMVEQHGFARADVEAVFKNTRHIDSAIQLVKPAPIGQPKNWQAYRARFVEPKRIAAGLAFWSQHADTLARAEKEYGVPAEIIVGILGVETLYGQNTGGFRVIDVLATLAFDYPDTPNRAARMDYFKSELENALLFARESSIDPFSLKGSYAGAIGLPQFMPGSIRKYAVDYDGDGKIDLRNSPDDAIGSIASFLVQHGWHRGEPTVFPATVATPVDDAKKHLAFLYRPRPGSQIHSGRTRSRRRASGSRPAARHAIRPDRSAERHRADRVLAGRGELLCDYAVQPVVFLCDVGD